MPGTIVEAARSAEQIVNDHTQRFLDPLHTNAMTREVADSVRGGNDDAYFVPAVQFVIDATLAVCRDAARRDLFPREVAARANRAADTATMIAEGAIRTN